MMATILFPRYDSGSTMPFANKKGGGLKKHTKVVSAKHSNGRQLVLKVQENTRIVFCKST